MTYRGWTTATEVQGGTAHQQLALGHGMRMVRACWSAADSRPCSSWTCAYDPPRKSCRSVASTAAALALPCAPERAARLWALCSTALCVLSARAASCRLPSHTCQKITDTAYVAALWWARGCVIGVPAKLSRTRQHPLVYQH